MLAAAAVVLAAVAAAAFQATRDSVGGLGEVAANHVGVIDPATGAIVAAIPVGIRPGPLAAGGGSVWVGNLQDRSLTRIDARRRSAGASIGLEGRTRPGSRSGRAPSGWLTARGAS